MPISQEINTRIQSILDNITSNKAAGPSALVFVAVDKDGKTLTSHSSGTIGVRTDTPVTLDTTFFFASCTKLLTAIAVMQIVEAGKIGLDDSAALYEVAPELKAKKMVAPDEDAPFTKKLVDKPNDITLRMLLCHTAGFAYSVFNKRLHEYSMPEGFDELSADSADILDTPLVNPPGSKLEYGVNMDWAGVVVERLSGMKLNAYFQKHLFEPLGIRNISMFPSDEMKANLARMHQRWPGSDGNSIEEVGHACHRPLIAKTDEERERIFNSGGAGCFGKPTDYCQILSALLNNGLHAPTNARILSPSSISTLLTNQLPHMPDFGRDAALDAAKPHLTNSFPELFPQEGNPPQGWSFAGFKILQPLAPTGRAAGSVHWAGVSNVYWWLDPATNVAGMIASSVLPFGDPRVMGAWFACEKEVYDALA